MLLFGNMRAAAALANQPRRAARKATIGCRIPRHRPSRWQLMGRIDHR